jgi:hypothetical protein
MIFGALYLFSTVVFPIKQTYKLLKNDTKEELTEQLWAFYWGIFSILLLLKSYFPFLNM